MIEKGRTISAFGSDVTRFIGVRSGAVSLFLIQGSLHSLQWPILPLILVETTRS